MTIMQWYTIDGSCHEGTHYESYKEISGSLNHGCKRECEFVGVVRHPHSNPLPTQQAVPHINGLVCIG